MQVEFLDQNTAQPKYELQPFESTKSYILSSCSLIRNFVSEVNAQSSYNIDILCMHFPLLSFLPKLQDTLQFYFILKLEYHKKKPDPLRPGKPTPVCEKYPESTPQIIKCIKKNINKCLKSILVRIWNVPKSK